MALIAGKITEKFPIIDTDPASVEQKKSLVYAIEEAFMKEWSNVMGTQEKPAHNKQMQLLFLAVAEGVVNHLKSDTISIEIDNVKFTEGGITRIGTVTGDLKILP